MQDFDSLNACLTTGHRLNFSWSCEDNSIGDLGVKNVLFFYTIIEFFEIKAFTKNRFTLKFEEFFSHKNKIELKNKLVIRGMGSPF
jgi:hypothetical protein